MFRVAVAQRSVSRQGLIKANSVEGQVAHIYEVDRSTISRMMTEVRLKQDLKGESYEVERSSDRRNDVVIVGASSGVLYCSMRKLL
jgi:hypothetical protein